METFQIFIEEINTGKIRFTSKGIQRFKRKFREIGVDIDTIKDREEFMMAYEVYLNTKLFRTAINNDDPKLDELLKNIPAYREGMEIRKGLQE